MCVGDGGNAFYFTHFIRRVWKIFSVFVCVGTDIFLLLFNFLGIFMVQHWFFQRCSCKYSYSFVIADHSANEQYWTCAYMNIILDGAECTMFSCALQCVLFVFPYSQPQDCREQCAPTQWTLDAAVGFVDFEKLGKNLITAGILFHTCVDWIQDMNTCRPVMMISRTGR